MGGKKSLRSSANAGMSASSRKGHGSPSKELLQDVVHRIVDVAHPLKIILFGSAARGEMGQDSDLDFLVIVKGPVRRLDVEQAIHLNLFGVGAPVDALVATEEQVQKYGRAVGSVIRPALEEGRVIYAV